MLKVTPEQRANLLKLADYLYALPDNYEKFHMGTFATQESKDELFGLLELDPSNVLEGLHNCGTTACAIGHGPACGIKPEPLDLTWGRYADRAFGADLNSRVFNFCFAGAWEEYDNTPKGAAQRIYYLLDNGIAGLTEPLAKRDFMQMYQHLTPNITRK